MGVSDWAFRRKRLRTEVRVGSESPPKDLKAIGDPCRLLKPQQLREIGATNPTKATSGWNQEQCTWRNQPLRGTVAPDTVQSNELNYAAKTYGDDNGNPTTKVDTHPAVHAAADEISCTTSVDVSDTEMFTVLSTARRKGRQKPDFSKPCEVSDKIAGMVVSNLPPV